MSDPRKMREFSGRNQVAFLGSSGWHPYRSNHAQLESETRGAVTATVTVTMTIETIPD